MSKKVKLLDTTPLGINAAGIDFLIEKKLILIHTFSDNCMAAYEVKPK